MVIQRKLTALQYPKANNLNMKDEEEFKRIVLWLEKNKIRKCDKKLLDQLSDVKSTNWNDIFERYLTSMGCPENINREAQIDWLAGCALKISYEKEKNKFNKHAVENLKKSNVPSVKTDNPLDSLDFSCQEFIDGVKNLARVLKISIHPNHFVTLEACRKVVEQHLFCERDPSKIAASKGTPFPYHTADLGFDLGDVGLNHAAKVLRLIYIQDLRNLQTKGNELVVSVQSVTANPKTDTKLGKVGK